MENRKKVLNLLGLATRAGKTASGEFMTEKAIKSGKAYLVIVSEEASDNTKRCLKIPKRKRDIIQNIVAALIGVTNI